MFDLTSLALLLGVVAVGVLHTMVPDHWAPIALLARQRGWSRGETARAAAQAGAGHVLTTLIFGIAVWWIGASAAGRFGHVVDLLASAALVGFGLWIAIGAYREMRRGEALAHDDHYGHHHDGHHHHGPHGHTHAHASDRDPLYAPLRSGAVSVRHVHIHRHGGGVPHLHWHDHSAATAHAVTLDTVNAPPLHEHLHRTSGRTALLLVLGSSPMVEGIPAFFAASRYGAGLIVAMSIAFAASTIATYVVLSVASASGLQRLRLGRFEQYGEVVSGLVMALIGLGFGAASLF
jgi:hypothetical protein